MWAPILNAAWSLDTISKRICRIKKKKIQRRVARMITGMKSFSDKERLDRKILQLGK